MKKELLTKEKILKEIRHSQKHYTPVRQVKSENFVIWVSMLISCLAFIISISPFAFLFLFVPVIYFLIKDFPENKKIKQLCETDFSVHTDRMTSVREKYIDVAGDLFNLAQLNENKKISVAYNQKFFDYRNS